MPTGNYKQRALVLQKEIPGGYSPHSGDKKMKLTSELKIQSDKNANMASENCGCEDVFNHFFDQKTKNGQISWLAKENTTP
jgi:hypothetical protein